MTAYNTPTWAAHPGAARPAWYRPGGHWLAAAAGGVTVPVMYYHYAHH